MGIKGELFAFTKENVDAAPASSGVYELNDNSDAIYIGRASGTGVTIRSRLQSHLRGDEGHCTKGAVAYRREITAQPISREKELLNEFFNLFGRLPRCNDRVG